MLICCISFSQHETGENVKSYIGIHGVDLNLTWVYMVLLLLFRYYIINICQILGKWNEQNNASFFGCKFPHEI